MVCVCVGGERLRESELVVRRLVIDIRAHAKTLIFHIEANVDSFFD